MKIIEYIIRVWLNSTFGRHFYWGNTVFTIDNTTDRDNVKIDVVGKSNNIMGTKAWENDMVNSILDGFKGTNMKMINKIEY